MKMKKRSKLSLAAFILLGLVAVAGIVSAFGPNFNSEDRDAIRQAIEDNDYESWKSLMESKITEENFNNLVERHQDMQQHREEMENAIEEGYEAWKEAVADTPMEDCADQITEENFDQFVEMHNARKEGDFETANEIAEELGLDCGMNHRIGPKMRHKIGPEMGE